MIEKYKIKLCILFDDLKIGGAPKLMSEIINLLNKEIFSIRVVVLDEKNGDKYIVDQLKNCEIKYLGIKNSINMLANIMSVYNDLTYNDFVISFSSDSNLYCAIIKKYFKNIAYFICFTHGIDGYYIDDEYFNKIKKNFGLLYKIKEKYLLNYYLKYYDMFITVCDSLKTYLTDTRNVNPDVIQTVYLGLIIEKYYEKNSVDEYNSVRNNLGIGNSDFVIIYSGRLSYAKGLERLIETYYSFRNGKNSVKLIILGNGELKDYLVHQTLKYNLDDDCIFIDFNSDYISYINAADLFLLPSISESTNLGVQEAMIMKKLVLSSDAGGIPELISNNENGFLFKTGDYKDLLSKMEYIYENREKFEDVKISAKQEIIKRFNLTKNVAKIEDLLIQTYTELL